MTIDNSNNSLNTIAYETIKASLLFCISFSKLIFCTDRIGEQTLIFSQSMLVNIDVYEYGFRKAFDFFIYY